MNLGTDSSSADENDYVNSVFWWLFKILFTATLHFISIEVPDFPQINDELYTFSRIFLAKAPIYKLTLEI